MRLNARCDWLADWVGGESGEMCVASSHRCGALGDHSSTWQAHLSATISTETLLVSVLWLVMVILSQKLISALFRSVTPMSLMHRAVPLRYQTCRSPDSPIPPFPVIAPTSSAESPFFALPHTSDRM